MANKNKVKGLKRNCKFWIKKVNKYTHIPHHLKMSALTIEIPIILIDCGKNICANIVAPKFKLGENELDIDHKALGFIVIEFDI